MEKEVWKDIPNFEGYYQVSNLGNVKSLKRKDSIGRRINEIIMKPTLDSSGYLGVSLFINRKRYGKHVHVLVAESFLGHVPNGQNIVVDHKDRNPTNNKLDNLQLVTHKVNVNKDKKILDKGYTHMKEINISNNPITIFYDIDEISIYEKYKLVKI